MKTFLALALLALVATAAIPEEDDVQVLTDDNFDEAIKSEFILVEFYAPWCGHCKKLTPEYSAAAKKLKSAAKPVPLAKVDATVQKKCSGKYDIKGFPTIKFFNNGNVIDYTGGRTADEIVNWINKRTGDVSQLISTSEELEKLTKDNRLAVVYFTEQLSGEHWDTFKSVAMNYDKIVFAHSQSAELATAQKSALGKLVLFKQFDELRNDYEGEFNAEALKAFINEKKLATVMDFDDTAIEVVFQKGTPTIFLFSNEVDASKAALDQFEQTAKDMKADAVKFCAVKPSNQHWQRLADYIGVNTAKIPAVMIVKASQDIEKYKFEQAEFTVENFKKFIADYHANALTQHVKSEDIPASNDEPVKVIVGKQFEELVTNSSKDVLIKFYAPWCGHCKNLIPAWNEAAEKLQVNPNILIAKCDSTQNEIANVEVKGFPTIKFFPGNEKGKQIDFAGERNTEGIISWLKQHTTHPWVELDGAKQEETKQEETKQEEPKKDDL